MTRKFAFTISLVDWIRKLSHTYEAPIDFIDNFVGMMYRPGATIGISTNEDEITIESDTTIDELVFEELRKNQATALARFIPPSSDFEELGLVSGNHYVEVDPSRRVNVENTPAQNGTRVVIRRNNTKPEELARLKKFYSNSDMTVSINGEVVPSLASSFPFETSTLSGVIAYNPRSSGGVSYFVGGRKISTVPLAPGLDVMLYRHDAPVTITKSKVITGGKGKASFDALEKALPAVVLDFLASEYLAEIKQRSLVSYQTAIRSVFSRFGDNQDIADVVKENIRFFGNDGKTNQKYTINYVRTNPSVIPQSERRLYEKLTGEQLIDAGQQANKISWGRTITLASSLAMLAAGVVMLSPSVNPAKVEVAAQQSGGAEDVNRMRLEIDRMLPSSRDALKSGGDYLSRDELARALTGKRDRSGYVRDATANHVDTDWGGNIIWLNMAPFDKLVSAVDAPLPTDLEKLVNSSETEKLAGVNRFMHAYFKYGEISPEIGKKYRNMVDAMIAERRAICSNANSLAAMYLANLDITNVRYAVGTRDGIGHAWLEIYKDNVWKIIDFTPAKMDEELMKRIKEFGGVRGGVAASVPNYLDTLDAGLNIETAFDALKQFDPSSYSITDEIEAIMHDPLGYFATSLIQPGLLLIGGSFVMLLGAGAYAGVSTLTRKKSFESGNRSIDDDLVALKKLSDLMGFEVKPSDSLYVRRGTLFVPRTYLSRSPLDAANELAASLDIPEVKKLEIYHRIAGVAE